LADVGHWQVPPSQISNDGQAAEQAPQWSGSVERFEHVLLQFICPAGQPVAQPSTPASESAHTGVADGHDTPHPPQLEGSESDVAQPVPASAQSA
jgi:hypothetical protein